MNWIPAAITAAAQTAGSLLTGHFNRRQVRRTNRIERRLARHQYSIAARDMEAAGLSKTLAAGSPAAVPQQEAPRQENNPIAEGLDAFAQAIQMQAVTAETERTREQRKLLEAQKDRIETLTPLEAENIGARTTAQRVETTIKQQLHPENLNKIRAEIRAIGARTANTQADTELKKLGYSEKEIDIATKRIRMDLAKLDQDIRNNPEYGDAIARYLLIEAAQTALAMSKHEYNYWRNAKSVPGAGGIFTKDLMSLQGFISTTLQDLAPGWFERWRR